MTTWRYEISLLVLKKRGYYVAARRYEISLQVIVLLPFPPLLKFSFTLSLPVCSSPLSFRLATFFATIASRICLFPAPFPGILRYNFASVVYP